MNQRIVVTADDFGACNFIDDGVKKAIHAGVVSSVAVMVNFEERDENHPYGAYQGSMKAIKELAEEVRIWQQEQRK